MSPSSVASLERPSTQDAASAWHEPPRQPTVEIIETSAKDGTPPSNPNTVYAMPNGRVVPTTDPTIQIRAVKARQIGVSAMAAFAASAVLVTAILVIRGLIVDQDPVPTAVRPVVATRVEALRDLPQPPAAAESATTPTAEPSTSASASAPESTAALATAAVAPPATPASTASPQPVDISSLPVASAVPGSQVSGDPSKTRPGETTAKGANTTAKSPNSSPMSSATAGKLPDFGGRE